MKQRQAFNGLLLVFLVLPLFHLHAFTENERGPVYTRNQVLNQFIFFQFRPLKASLPKKDFKLITDLSHSNIIRVLMTDSYSTWTDMAVSHLTIHPFYKFADDFELSLNTGVLSYWGGFMDHPLQSFHKAFNFPNGQRDQVGDDQIRYSLGSRKYKIVDRRKPATSLRDTSIMLRYKALDTRDGDIFKDFVLSFAAGIELPTGYRPYGTSNGSIDWGLGLYSEKGFFERRFYIYYLTSIIKLGGFNDHNLSMPVKKVKLQHSLSFEYLPWDFLSFLVQADTAKSPYRTYNKFLDISPWLIVFGVNLFRSNYRMCQLSFTEDLNHKTTPDFTVQMTFFQDF